MRFIPDAVTRKAALALLKTQSHSPTILFGAGVVGVVATAVLASKATLRVTDVLDEHVEMIKIFEKTAADEKRPYTQEDLVKDKALLFAQTGIKLAKLYGPSLAVAAVSIGCLAGSHRILTRRNAALTAAYAAVEKGFRAYRDRVIDDAGVDKDREYLYGIEKEKITVTDDDGKKKIVTAKVATSTVSPYGKIFHEGNPDWSPLPEYSLFFLRCQQKVLNQQLAAKGYLFLSDVYEALNYDQTPASRVVGWLYDTTKYGGDGYVDFGIFDREDIERVHDFIQGREGELYLDFNVLGDIHDKI